MNGRWRDRKWSWPTLMHCHVMCMVVPMKTAKSWGPSSGPKSERGTSFWISGGSLLTSWPRLSKDLLPMGCDAVLSCSLWSFEGLCCLHLQVPGILLGHTDPWGRRLCRTVEGRELPTWRQSHIPGEVYLQQHRCPNRRSVHATLWSKVVWSSLWNIEWTYKIDE
jgi:hypothetical protein